MILDGNKVSKEILNELKNKIDANNYKICLSIILVGNNYASEIYVRNKIKRCEEVGIKVNLYRLDETITEEDLIKLITELNNDNEVNGIILQSPLPSGIDFEKCSSMIKPHKDIDGLSIENTYLNYANKDCILPCTVSGIIKLLNYYNIPIKGSNITIIGKGNLVGKPLNIALLNLGATTTVCSRSTKSLKEHTLNANIIITCAGYPNILNKDMINNNPVVIDVGINRVDNKLTGDVNYEEIKDYCSYITPVPGGVGPMTVACVASNLVESYERNNING